MRNEAIEGEGLAAMTAEEKARRAAAYCLEATGRGGSNLWLVSRGLPARRRAMFAAAYASMREIDDFVDDGFLALEPDRRAAERAAARRRVEEWRRQCAAALSGDPLSGDLLDSEAVDGVHPLIRQALSDTLGASDLGAGPWNALAQAMRRDVDETPFQTWSDFDAYCEGATVAPAAIFLYVLSARFEAGRAIHTLPAAIEDCARDMAVFCYLVHIARDLTKDAAASANLITLPQDALAACGLTREGLNAHWSGRSGQADSDDGVVALVATLADRAASYRDRAEAWRRRVSENLGLREKAALTALMSVYKALHDHIAADPAIVLSRDPAIQARLKQEALAAASVAPP